MPSVVDEKPVETPAPFGLKAWPDVIWVDECDGKLSAVRVDGSTMFIGAHSEAALRSAMETLLSSVPLLYGVATSPIIPKPFAIDEVLEIAKQDPEVFGVVLVDERGCRIDTRYAR